VISVTAAQSLAWPLRLDCCGRPLWDKNNQLSLNLTRRKSADAREAGAQALITACTHCQLQFDTVRQEHPARNSFGADLPAMPVSRLLAAALGLSDCVLDG
jgi:heterodisulfide reductase subunit B